MSLKLKVEDLRSGYGDINILWDINFELERGETLVVLGPNGSGKTTLLNTLIGILKCKKGHIIYEVDGSSIDICKLTTTERVRKGISLVPEGRLIFPRLSVKENLLLAARIAGTKNLSEKLEFVYKIFPRLKERESQVAGSLSGGEQQMLAIGRSLMANPRVLLIDEPSQGLAPIIVGELAKKLRELKDAGIILVIAEQQISDIVWLADKVLVLEIGHPKYSGPLSGVIDSLKELYIG
ncbi:MAG: ABC transporter ATP-binding protein [Desulfurococcaceae archaeon]